MTETLSVIILTTKLPEDIWLVNNVAEVCNIKGIVVPVGSRYREFGTSQVFRKRIRRFGPFAVANQALLFLYRLVVESRKDERAIKELFSDKPHEYIEKTDMDILEVEDINSEEVRHFILSKAPQLVVVSGTPLLKKRIIESAERRIINLHPGFAPQYRGRYGAFWPIYNGEPELVGTTIHFLDEGVDTGAILLRQQVDFFPADTLKTITYRQQKVGVDLLIKCLTQFEMLAPLAYRQNGYHNNNYYAPGLTHYLKARRWLRQKNQKGKL